jgi:hypothetical protein
LLREACLAFLELQLAAQRSSIDSVQRPSSSLTVILVFHAQVSKPWSRSQPPLCYTHHIRHHFHHTKHFHKKGSNTNHANSYSSTDIEQATSPRIPRNGKSKGRHKAEHAGRKDSTPNPLDPPARDHTFTICSSGFTMCAILWTYWLKEKTVGLGRSWTQLGSARLIVKVMERVG